MCTIDPDSRWNFFVHNYELEPRPDGVPYDDDGPPDLDVEVVSPTTTVRIAIIAGPDNASSSEFTPPRLIGANIPATALSSYLSFRVSDRDELYDDLLGAYTWFWEIPFDGSIRTAVFPPDPLGPSAGFRIQWHLERADR